MCVIQPKHRDSKALVPRHVRPAGIVVVVAVLREFAMGEWYLKHPLLMLLKCFSLPQKQKKVLLSRSALAQPVQVSTT